MRLFALFLAVSSFALADTRTEHFVTSAGAGAADGSSWANAWSFVNLNTSGNWGAGEGKIGAGEFVYLSGGIGGVTYSGDLSMLGSGSAGNPITIRAGAGHASLSGSHDGKVTISGSILCSTRTYITIDGTWQSFPTVTNWIQAATLTADSYKFKVECPDGTGINFKGSNSIFSKIEVGNCGTDEDAHHGFLCNPGAGSEPTGAVIEYCFIHDNMGDGFNQNVSAANDETAVIIRFCHFKGNAVDGVQASGGLTVMNCMMDGTGNIPSTHADGMQVSAGYLHIKNNAFLNWPQSIFVETITSARPFDNIKIVNNTFWNTSGTYQTCASLSNNGPASVSLDGFVFAYNTIDALIDRTYLGLTANPEVFVIRNSLIENNIFYDCPLTHKPINVENHDISADTDLLIRNNQFYGNEKFTYEGVAYTTVGALVAAHPDFTGNIVANVSWVDRSARNYQLNSGNAGILAGIAVPGFTTDAVGVARGSPPDIGAFEYLPPTGGASGNFSLSGNATLQ